MTIQLFPEQLAQTSFRDRMRARAAVLMSNRLAKSKPERIERVIGRWAAKYPVTDIESARKDRAAVCFVSGRARSQEGCLLRSISVARAAKLRRRSITWCSGFAVEPFRGHAWVEVGGTPVTEFAELREYTKSIEIRANGDTAVSADESADADSNRDETIDVPATAPAGPRDLFRLAKGRGRLLVGVGLLAIVSSGLTLAIPSFISRLFSSGTFKFPGMGMIGAFLGLILASGVATVFQHYYLQKVGESIVNDARRKLSRHLLRLQIKEYDERKTGDLISRVASDTSRLRTGFLQVFLAGTTGIPLILGAGVIMLVIDPVLLGTALMLIALMGLLIAVVSRVIQGTSLAAQHELGELTSRVERDMTAIRTIRAANATASESASL
ncbi:MAG: lasso peptide biosynthesis B2 protein, partial [Peptidiphaga sp.]